MLPFKVSVVVINCCILRSITQQLVAVFTAFYKIIFCMKRYFFRLILHRFQVTQLTELWDLFMFWSMTTFTFGWITLIDHIIMNHVSYNASSTFIAGSIGVQGLVSKLFCSCYKYISKWRYNPLLYVDRPLVSMVTYQPRSVFIQFPVTLKVTLTKKLMIVLWVVHWKTIPFQCHPAKLLLSHYVSVFFIDRLWIIVLIYFLFTFIIIICILKWKTVILQC